MRKLIVVSWLIFLLAGILAVFWHYESVYRSSIPVRARKVYGCQLPIRTR